MPLTLFTRFTPLEELSSWLVAAGESAKPYKSVPRAIKATFLRITLFYVLTILTIGLCINHADDTLLNANSKYPINILFGQIHLNEVGG